MPRIIHILFVATLVALFSTVCIVDTSLWRGVITGKYFWFASVMCIALPLWCIRFYATLQKKPVIRNADVAFAAFAIYVVFRYLLTEGTGGDMHRRFILLMIPLYVMIRNLMESRDMYTLLPGIISIVAFLETVWGILQLCGCLPSYHREFRITGSLFNPGPYAGFVAVCLPIALSQALSRPVTSGKHLPAIAASVTSLSVLPFTGSRAAWLAALVGSAVVLWPVFGKRTIARIPRNKRIAGIMMGAVVVLTLLYGAYRLKKESADGRRLIWKVCISMIGEQPLFGAGSGRFAAIYGNAQAEWFAAGKGNETEIAVAGNPAYAFNEWLHIAVEFGLIGLFLFGSAVILCLGNCRTDDTGGGNRAYRSALFSFLVFASFSYPFDVLPLAILFTVLVAATASNTQALHRQPGSWYSWAGMVFCVVLTGIVSFGILRNRQYYADWREAYALLLAGSYYDALEEYEYLYDGLQHEKLFLMEYARCLAHTRQYGESNRIFTLYLTRGGNPEAYNYMGSNYQMMGQYDRAEQAYTRSAQTIPGRLMPRYLLMRLYMDAGRHNRAAEMARFLTEMPVKIPSSKADAIKREAQTVLDEWNSKK